MRAGSLACCPCLYDIVPADNKGAGRKGTGKVRPPEATLEELRAECKKRGMTGISHLNKKDLIKRMEGDASEKNVTCYYC